MKKFLPFLMLAASCSTVHKVSHTEKKTSDSAVVVTKDSSYKSSSSTQTNDLDVKDVDVTVYYNDTFPASTDADIALAKAISRPVDRTPMKTGNKKLDSYAELIKQALSGTGNVSAIQIHIGSISDSSTQTHATDTGAVHSHANSRVKTEDNTVDKKVDRTGLSIGAKIGIGVALLIGLVILLIWLAKKLHII